MRADLSIERVRMWVINMIRSINCERRCLKWLNRSGWGTWFLVMGIAASFGAEKKTEIPPELQAEISKAMSEDYPLFAPSHFGEVKRLFEDVETALGKGESAQQIGVRSEQTMRALKEAGSVAANVRAKLSGVLGMREEARHLDLTMAQRLARAEQLLGEASAKVEAGKWEEADRAAQAALMEYWREGGKFLAERKLPRMREEIDRLRGKAPGPQLDAVEKEFQAIATALQESSPGKLLDLDRRIVDIFKRLYPGFYRDPPMVLQIGGFTLYVESYEGRWWDFRNQTISGASGIAWVSFDCHPKKIIWYPGLLTTILDLTVVETVKDPAKQISVADAKKIDPTRPIGSALEVPIPIYAKTGPQIAESIQDITHWVQQPKGDIKVHFDNLTIVPGATPGSGVVVSGSAIYPTAPPYPETVILPVAGFTLYIHKLTFTPNSAMASGELEMPVSIVDPGSGHPGRVPLGDFTITNDCKFRRELPAAAFGPWSVGNTEMLVCGTGVIADFDDAWVAPGLPASSAAANPGWRGVVLDHGETVPTSDKIISNSGYLRANYSFNKAEITAPGWKGNFKLSAPFEFMSLEPMGYIVRVSHGEVYLADSAVFSGEFKNDTLVAPKAAVEKAGGGTFGAKYSVLKVDINLDLKGSVDAPSGIRWGEYSQHNPRPTFYETGKPAVANFYLSGTYRKNYFPVDGAGAFVEPNALIDPVTTGIQGLSIFFPERLTIFTPDTPGQKPLVFAAMSKDRERANWFNISFEGVHGRVSDMCTEDDKTDLGPIEKQFYAGNPPKVPFRKSSASGNVKAGCRGYTLTSTFVSSAVYDCDMSGILHIPKPVDSDLNFANMAFTSTAQNAGGKVPFTNPLKLSHWGLDMVKKPSASSAGVISVRTGQVFFTAAGIRESRHFAEPFYLTWGEMLASGALRRLVFDYDSAGQKFDRFHYTPSFVRLSDYDAANPTKPAYLKVGGTAHVDFFGAKYINLHDIYEPAKPFDPFNSRVITLMSDSSAGLFGPTDSKLIGKWSDDFGGLDFIYKYDDAAQDGFVGTGQTSFLWISGMTSASIVVKAERICVSVNDTNRHDFTLGPVAHFGVMSRITGCGCIESGQLERVMLSAELETTVDANIVLRSAGYGSIEWMLTPSISQLEIQGDMYLSLLGHGNIEARGRARFTVDRVHDFVEGEVDGKFNSDSALGINSVSADGQLNWHLAKVDGQSYQSIQGRVAVSVITPLAGAGVEGGLYIGMNAPQTEAWVLASGGDKFSLTMASLPARLTGIYGYVKLSQSVNAYVFSGGIETYAGLGGFVTPIPGAPTEVGLPFVVGNLGVHIWGEILGGAVSAGGWADLNVIAPYPFSFRGTLGLEGCVAWVFCDSVDVSVGLDQDGLFAR